VHFTDEAGDWPFRCLLDGQKFIVDWNGDIDTNEDQMQENVEALGHISVAGKRRQKTYGKLNFE
jgi:hypothetical protein